MRRILLSAAAAIAMLSSMAIMADRAEAMTLAAPAGMQEAVGDVNLAQDAAYVCRRVWRCGYYGCGWRRACWWTGGGYYYGRHRYYRHGYYRHW